MRIIKGIFGVLSILSLSFSAISQGEIKVNLTDKGTVSDSSEIFVMVEDNPSFPGGQEARIKFLVENINYPNLAKEQNIQGTVYLQFVVEKDGRITHVKVLRGVGGGIDEEAVRVTKAMPNWNPGKQLNKPVRVQFNMPIKFVLSEESKNKSSHKDKDK